MIGMVLWCDPEARKAVIWCEDQGDLAFYEEVEGAIPPFDAGDMVEFEIIVEGSFRRATSARLVQEGVCTALPQRLRNSAAPMRPKEGRIVGFPDGSEHRDNVKRVSAGRR